MNTRLVVLVALMLALGAVCAYLWIGYTPLPRAPEGGTTGAPAEPPPAEPAPEFRVVVLSPALAITLRALGVSPIIVGRHAEDLLLDKSIPVCGDQQGIDYEALLRANPTHVLLQWGSRPLPARLEEMAAEHHWTVRNYDLLSFEDIRKSMVDLQREFAGLGTIAKTAHLADALGTKGDYAKAGRVLLLSALDPAGALGPGSWHHEILVKLGGTPAITEGAAYITLDAEDVLRLAPDGIVLILPRRPDAPARESPPTQEELRALLGRIGTLDIPAVRGGRVALLDDPYSLTPSTAMIGFAYELGEILRGWSQ